MPKSVFDVPVFQDFAFLDNAELNLLAAQSYDQVLGEAEHPLPKSLTPGVGKDGEVV